MKSVRFVLLVLMLCFMGVQYNDPDGLFWIVIYGAVASVLAMSVWRPSWMGKGWVQGILVVLTLSLAFAAWYHWPTQERFWQQEIWWEEETAREGMGMMIALLFLLFALPVAFARRSAHE